MELAFPLDSDRLSVVLKVTGETCNINCLYCYEKRKPYAGSKFMEPELLRQFLDLTGPRPLTVMLHGGGTAVGWP